MQFVKPHQVCFEVRGDITLHVDSQADVYRRYVYQRVGRGLGNIAPDRQLRLHVVPNHPDTEEQLRCRRRFRAAVQAWQALDPVERDAYRVRARRRLRHGYHLFLSEWTLAHPVTEFAEGWIRELYAADSRSMVSPLTVRTNYLQGAL